MVLAIIHILEADPPDRVVIKQGQREAALPIQQAALKNMWPILIVGIDIHNNCG